LKDDIYLNNIGSYIKIYNKSKIMKSFIIAALFGTVSSLESLTTTHATTLTCGLCIMGGYNFCMMSLDGSAVSGSTKCCIDTSITNCAEATNIIYSCSNKYVDRTYAATMCP